MELRKVAESATTLTLAWVAIPTAQVFAFYSDGELRSTGTKNYTSGEHAGQPRTEVRFSKVGEPYEVAALLRDASGAFGVDSGAYREVAPPPDPDPDPDADIDLLNKTWKPEGNWGALDFVRVRVLNAGQRIDNVHLSGTGTVKRFFGETDNSDMFKVHGDADGIVIGTYAEQSEFYSREFVGEVHQDGIQAMGGGPAKFVGFYMQKDAPGNSHLFTNMGAGGQSRPHDVVVEFSVINGYRGNPATGHRGGTPVKIFDSAKCGIRHSLVVNSGLVAPLITSPAVTDPVVEDSYSMTHADWDSIGGDANGPRHRDLWNANGSHKPALDALISNGKAKLLSA